MSPACGFGMLRVFSPRRMNGASGHDMGLRSRVAAGRESGPLVESIPSEASGCFSDRQVDPVHQWRLEPLRDAEQNPLLQDFLQLLATRLEVRAGGVHAVETRD